MCCIKDNMLRFCSLVEDQFQYGGRKYALTTTKESTDVLFDIHGYRWLIGTIHKYIFRYTNLARGRDLLKIATYMYILWLKRGYHLTTDGQSTPLDTTVEVKSKYFNKFINDMLLYSKGFTNLCEFRTIDDILKMWSEEEWTDINSTEIYEIFLIVYREWNEKYGSDIVQDTDTWNEGKE